MPKPKTLDSRIELARQYSRKCDEQVVLADRLVRQGIMPTAKRQAVGRDAIIAGRLLDALVELKRKG
jgi:hypothetical protein